MIPSKNLLFDAVRRRWDDQGLGGVGKVTGGIRDSVSPERTERPYAVIECLEDAPFQRTNCSRYDKVTFQVTVVGPTHEKVGQLSGVVDDALQLAPLGIHGEGARLVVCQPAPVKYGEAKNYAFAILGYVAIVRRNRTMQPALAG